MSILVYILQVSVCLAIFYGFYHVWLRKETLFESNRTYILVTLISSFSLPLLKIYIDTAVNAGKVISAPVHIGSYVEAISYELSAQPASPFPWDKLLTGIYAIGIAFLSIRLFKAIHEINQIRRIGDRINILGYTCIISDKVKTPFSFFNSIYLPKDHRFNDEELREVVAHELAHVHGKHTLDVLLVETACIFLWPSPLIYLYRKALKDIHEYVADAAVLKETPWELYAGLLLHQQKGQLQNVLSNQLIYSQLKKRLLMMNKERSGTLARFKYLGVVPILLLALTLFSFRERIMPDLGQTISAQQGTSDSVIHFKVGPDMKIYFGLTRLTEDQFVSILDSIKINSPEKEIMVQLDPQMKVDDVRTITDLSLKSNLNLKFNVVFPDGSAGNSLSLINSDRDHPVFPGCSNVPFEDQEDCSMTNLSKYIQNNMVYPESVKLASIQGRVLVKFTVGANGLVKDIIVLESLHPDADQVVMKMVSEMNEKVGKWLPATKGGEAIDAEMHLPVKFALDSHTESAKPLQYAEELPRFPGCEEIEDATERSACATRKLYEFIYTNIQYPKVDRDNKVEGQCIVQFVIGMDGSLSNINVLRFPSESMKDEVKRLMSMMAALPDKWVPARNEGKAVAMQFTLPIKFKLEEKVIQVETPDVDAMEGELQVKTVTIVPNPATNEITIEKPEGVTSVSIFDEHGKQVLTEKVTTGNTTTIRINVSNLKPGWYAVQLSGDELIGTGKFSIIR